MSDWTVIRCMSSHETAAAARLTRLGYPHGWWPTKVVNAHSGAKSRALKAAKKRGAIVNAGPSKKIVPYIPGYVFVPCEVEIFRVKSHPEARLWMAALVINGKAVTIPDADMMRMRDIPERLRQYMAEIEEKLRKEREAKRPKLGETAIIIDGSFEGQKGLVIGMQPNEATPEVVKIDTGGILGHVTAPVEIVERVA